MRRALYLATALALYGCNVDRSGNARASGVRSDAAAVEDAELSDGPDAASDIDVLEEEVAVPSDALHLVDGDDAPRDVDTGLPLGCDLTGAELDCSEPNFTGLNVGSPCDGELLYNATRAPIPYGTRENAGLMAYEQGMLATLGVDPPTGTLCRLQIECDEPVTLLTGFEGPTFGVSFVQVGDVTYAFGTRWGAHRSLPAIRVETGALTRAWATGDVISWILLGEADGEMRIWQDVAAATPGIPAVGVGTMVGAGSQFSGVGSHRYFVLGNSFDGVLGHSLIESLSWEGPAERAWPISGHPEFVAVMESALDHELILLGSGRVPVGLEFAETDQLVVAGSFGTVAFARRTLEGAVEFAVFDSESDTEPQWRYLTDILPAGPIGGTLLSMHVSEEAGASKFALSYGFYGPHAFEISVARPQDPRCE